LEPGQVTVVSGKVRAAATSQEKCQIDVSVHWTYDASQIALTEEEISTSLYAIGTFVVMPADALGITSKKLKPICKICCKKSF
jgi:hypothetical protein